MKKTGMPKYTLTSMSLLCLVLCGNIYGQIQAGDYLTAQDMNKTIPYCANETGVTTIADLLQPPTKALFLNFFASY